MDGNLSVDDASVSEPNAGEINEGRSHGIN